MKLLAVITLALACALGASGQTLPNLVFFAGGSYEPNGGLQSASVEVGGAKLIGAGTYLGAVAHLGSKGVTPFQIKTRIQFHGAQKVVTFRGTPIFWSGEVGPDFTASTPPASPAAAVTAAIGTNIGYSVGSGPMASIAIGKRTYLMPHAEIVKGSLQDLGWRAGVLFGFGSD